LSSTTARLRRYCPQFRPHLGAVHRDRPHAVAAPSRNCRPSFRASSFASARAVLGRKPRCAVFSARAHQLQPDVGIWIGCPVVPVAPDRFAVGRLAGPKRSGAGAALSRWPVVIAGVCTPSGDVRGSSGPRRCCNGECRDCQHNQGSHHQLPNAGRSRSTASCFQPVYSVCGPVYMKLITLCWGRPAAVCAILRNTYPPRSATPRLGVSASMAHLSHFSDGWALYRDRGLSFPLGWGFRPDRYSGLVICRPAG
jgi:hypothetical protein